MLRQDKGKQWPVVGVVLVLTLVSMWLVGRLSLSPDVADLVPNADQGALLREYLRVFDRGDVATVLVQGHDPHQVRDAASDALDVLTACSVVRAAVDRVSFEVPSDPSLVWAAVGKRGHEALRAVLEPAAQAARLADAKRLLLTPGAAALVPWLQRDPLRLRSLPFETRLQVTGAATAVGSSALSTGSTDPVGALVADQGRSRLILLSAQGQSLRAGDAKGFTNAVNDCLGPARGRHRQVSIALTGSHAIAAETEQMLRRDLYVSGTVSALLVSLAFVVTFRRPRALLAVLPPLALGTLWTSAVAFLVFGRISALTLGFIAVVVGVGLDTGVHVYAALLHGRRMGLAGSEVAAFARRMTAKPTLVAAVTAAIAFASLALSRVAALQQFGILCAIGEVLTALGILVLTPAVGALLERGCPPPPWRPGWTACLQRFRRQAAAPLLVAVAVFAPVYVLVTSGLPKAQGALVAIRPSHLPSLQVQDRVNESFAWAGSQWVVVLRDRNEHAARTRADKLFDLLESEQNHVAAIDGLTRFAPSLATQRERLAQRDRLDLPSRVPVLRDALTKQGFQVDAFEQAMAYFEHPSHEIHDALERDTATNRLFRARYLAIRDGLTWVSMHVTVRPGHETAVQRLIHDVDPGAMITGYALLESFLADNMRADMPRVLAVSGCLVVAVILVSLRRIRDGLVAVAALTTAVAWVVAFVRWWPLPIHLYNAFVIPVLLGICVDEVMFLVYRIRSDGVAVAIDEEAPVAMVTGATTAAGFAALMACSFQGLKDMGVLGTVGSVAGLLAAIGVAPVLASIRRQPPHKRLSKPQRKP